MTFFWGDRDVERDIYGLVCFEGSLSVLVTFFFYFRDFFAEIFVFRGKFERSCSEAGSEIRYFSFPVL